MWTIISTVVAVVALYYGWRQTQLANRQTELAKHLPTKQEEEQREVFQWQRRHEELALVLSRVPPQRLVQSDGHQGAIWPILVPNNRLREQAEMYIVELVDNKLRLTPRKPTELELRSPALRETVLKVEQILEDCKKNRPELYKILRLNRLFSSRSGLFRRIE